MDKHGFHLNITASEGIETSTCWYDFDKHYSMAVLWGLLTFLYLFPTFKNPFGVVTSLSIPV